MINRKTSDGLPYPEVRCLAVRKLVFFSSATPMLLGHCAFSTQKGCNAPFSLPRARLRS